MCEHRLSDEIADRPNILDRRLALVVNLDEGPIHIHLHFLKAPAFCLRPAANGDEYLVGRNVSFLTVLELHLQVSAIGVAGEPRCLRAEMNSDAGTIKPFANGIGELLV